MKIQELKEEALTYKKKLDDAATSARKVITFDELEEIKKTTSSVNDSLKEIEASVTQNASPFSTNRTYSMEEPPLSTPASNIASEPVKIEEKAEVKAHV